MKPKKLPENTKIIVYIRAGRKEKEIVDRSTEESQREIQQESN